MLFPRDVGVLYGSVLMAVVIYYMAPKSYTFVEAWTAGAILSATDPVAVVAILKSLVAQARSPPPACLARPAGVQTNRWPNIKEADVEDKIMFQK